MQKRVIERYAHMPRSTVQHRLDRLVKWGFLAVQRHSRYLCYKVAGVAASDLSMEAAVAAAT